VTIAKSAAAAAMLLVIISVPVRAQPPADPASAPATPAQPAADRDDAVFVPAQPDFTLIALPTGLRLPVGKAAFRVTHRFLRSLGEGDFGDLAGDAFGLDNGALTALELRFGVAPGTQLGVHRSALGKTIAFFAERDVMSGGSVPLDVSAFASIEGTGNFKDSYSPAIGGVFTRILGSAGAIYIEPIFVGNTNTEPSDFVEHNSTFFIGLGTRLQFRRNTYVVAEWSPRVAGFDPGVDAIAFGFEKRVGGHMFQLNFSNHFATTMAQIARGGNNNDDWYFGFNLVRKFY
jgi:hypothetical protein